jgi:hypothetical protein
VALAGARGEQRDMLTPATGRGAASSKTVPQRPAQRPPVPSAPPAVSIG